MVAHVLQLPQVVGGHQHGGPPLGHVPHEQGPHLPPHHRVQAVHRFVQHHDVRHAAQRQPEGGLLLHALGQPPDGLLLVHGGEGVLQSLVPLVVKLGIESPVKLHHVPGGGGQEVVEVVGDPGHAALHRRIFVHRLAVHQDRARVGPVYPHDVPQDGGLARPVGAHQAVDGAALHRHGQAVQGPEPVEGLYHIVDLDHAGSPPSSLRTRSTRASPPTPRNSSSAVTVSKRPSSSSFRPWSTPEWGAAKEPFPGTEYR